MYRYVYLLLNQIVMAIAPPSCSTLVAIAPPDFLLIFNYTYSFF